MATLPHAARFSGTVARLREEALRAAANAVSRARAARQLGATAEAYRDVAAALDHQADRAKRLLFGQAVRTYCAAAAEHRLIAEALDAIEGA